MQLTRPWFADGAILRRSREIASVLTGHGLDSLVEQTGLYRVAPWRTRARHQPGPTKPAARLRAALGELGVTFIKLGQTLSTRADLLPADLIEELSRLQDAAPRVPLPEIRRIIREELGSDPELLFARFDPEPLASASIGQVHAACRTDGREVVIKVRRPNVETQVEADLDILTGIAEWAQSNTAIGRDYELRAIVEEFAYTIRNELDYRREGENADRFRHAFARDGRVWIPQIHWDLTSERVLTMERVTGVKLSDFATLDRLGISRRRLAENAVAVFLHQILHLGFFHADPHPGNFFAQPDGSIAMVDFGMVGRVTNSLRMRLLRAGLAALHEDPEALAEELFALGVAGRRADRPAFQRDLDHLIGRYGDKSLRELNAAAVTRELTDIAFRHRLQLPSDLALLFRVAAMSEGVGLQLDPDFHYLEFASPFLRERWREQHGLPATTRRLSQAAMEAAELAIEMPRRSSRLLARLERGELELNVNHEGLGAFSRQLQQMANRLSLAVMLAASVVALGLALGATSLPERAAHVSWLFWLGLVFSLAFGVGLLWSMWRARR